MEVNEAVILAKTSLLQTYTEQYISNVGLEEIEYDDAYEKWRITLGFSRPWDQNKNIAAVLNGAGPSTRVFKVVTIDEKHNKVISLKNRNVASSEREPSLMQIY